MQNSYRNRTPSLAPTGDNPGNLLLRHGDLLGFGRRNKTHGHAHNQGGPRFFLLHKPRHLDESRRGITDRDDRTIQKSQTVRLLHRLDGTSRVFLFCLVDHIRICDAVDLEYLLPAGEPGPGMTRTVLLRVHGWCKDTAPTTLTGARVEPLPWRGMPAYPCVPSPDEKNWAPRWNTRKFR